MNRDVKKAIFEAFKKEPFAQALGMKLVDLNDGFSVIGMTQCYHDRIASQI